MAKFDSFDREIQSKLDQFEPASKPDWSFMQSQLNLAEEDHQFDQKIKSILQDVQVNAKEIEWTEFQTKLKRHTERRQKIITTRALESVLVLLLLWTLDNIGLTRMIPYEKGIKSMEVFAQALGELKNDKSDSPTSSSHLKTKRETRNPYKLSHSAIHQALKIPAPNDEVAQDSRLHLQTSVVSVENTADVYKEENNRQDSKIAAGLQSGFASNAMEPAVNPEGILIPPDLSFASGLLQTSIKKAELHHSEELKLPSELSPLVLEDELDFDLELRHGIHPVAFHKQLKRWVGISAGLMVNSITSPSFIQNSVHFHQVQLGNQIGLFLGSQYGDWMLESGLSYQNIHYQPNMSETLGSFEAGYYKIRFAKLQSHIINIPVLVHRVLYSKPNWSIAVKAGLSISASLHNEFSVDTLTNLNGKPSQGILFDPNQQSEIASRVRSQANQGILQGGSVGVNSYANLVGGIRYDRDLNSRTRFFTELEFSKMLGDLGFGPNNDLFFTSSLKTGISFRF